MSILEQLIGIPLDQVSDDELDDLVMKGRVAREEESEGRKAKKTTGGKTPAKPKFEMEVDLDEFV